MSYNKRFTLTTITMWLGLLTLFLGGYGLAHESKLIIESIIMTVVGLGCILTAYRQLVKEIDKLQEEQK